MIKRLRKGFGFIISRLTTFAMSNSYRIQKAIGSRGASLILNEAAIFCGQLKAFIASEAAHGYHGGLEVLFYSYVTAKEAEQKSKSR